MNVRVVLENISAKNGPKYTLFSKKHVFVFIPFHGPTKDCKQMTSNVSTTT